MVPSSNTVPTEKSIDQSPAKLELLEISAISLLFYFKWGSGSEEIMWIQIHNIVSYWYRYRTVGTYNKKYNLLSDDASSSSGCLCVAMVCSEIEMSVLANWKEQASRFTEQSHQLVCHREKRNQWFVGLDTVHTYQLYNTNNFQGLEKSHCCAGTHFGGHKEENFIFPEYHLLYPTGADFVLVDHFKDNQHVGWVKGVFESDWTADNITGLDNIGRGICQPRLSTSWNLDCVSSLTGTSRLAVHGNPIGFSCTAVAPRDLCHALPLFTCNGELHAEL